MTMGITRKQADVLSAIESLTVDGVSPSYEEIAEHVGLGSKSGVHRCVEALVERGLIRRRWGRARALEVIAPDPLAGLSIGAMLALRDRIDRRLGGVA